MNDVLTFEVFNMAGIKVWIAKAKHEFDILGKQNVALSHRQNALADRLNELKNETAEWIDTLQGEDARLAARLENQEQEMVTCRRAFDAVAGGRAALSAHLDALEKHLSDEGHINNDQDEVITEHSQCLNALDKDVGLITALCKAHVTDTHNALERQLATNAGRLKLCNDEIGDVAGVLKRTGSTLADRLDKLELWRRAHHDTHNKEAAAVMRLNNALAERVEELKRLAGFRDKLIEKQHGMLAEQDAHIGALDGRELEVSAKELASRVADFEQRPAWERDDADDVDPNACACEGCGLPEDGLKVRNVTVRPSSGLRLCADCATVEIPF